MTKELMYLAWVAALTAVIWIPYMANAIVVWGPKGAMGYSENLPPLSPWAARMKKAHYNAIENLAVFATLVLIAHVAGIHTEMTATACVLYFWARVAHLLAYTFAIPVVRTLAFTAGFVAQVMLIAQICCPAM